MGKRGPPRLPIKILRQRGSWLADRRVGEPEAPPGRPKAPDRLKGEARKLYQQVVRLIEPMGILSPSDGGQLERYCTYFVRWRQCEDSLVKLGDNLLAIHLKEESSAIYRKLVRESRSLDAALKQIEREYALTPAARARFAIDTKEKAVDPDDDLFKPRIVG